MSRQEAQQQLQGNQNAQNQHLPLQRASRSNLYLDFSRSYETYYDRQRGQRRPVQSGFVSSTSWTTNDAMWYRAQTTYAPSNISSGPAQDSRVSCSRKDMDDHALRELLND